VRSGPCFVLLRLWSSWLLRELLAPNMRLCCTLEYPRTRRCAMPKCPEPHGRLLLAGTPATREVAGNTAHHPTVETDAMLSSMSRK